MCQLYLTSGQWGAELLTPSPPSPHNVHTAISASKTKELMNASPKGRKLKTFWMESKLKPGFFWFHILWSLTERKLSPTLKICTMKIQILLYLLGGENLHTGEPTQSKPTLFKGQLFISKTEKISLLHFNILWKTSIFKTKCKKSSIIFVWGSMRWLLGFLLLLFLHLWQIF